MLPMCAVRSRCVSVDGMAPFRLVEGVRTAGTLPDVLSLREVVRFVQFLQTDFDILVGNLERSDLALMRGMSNLQAHGKRCWLLLFHVFCFDLVVFSH